MRHAGKRLLVAVCCLVVGLAQRAAVSRRGAGRVSGGRVTVDSVTSPVVHAEGPHWDTAQGVLYYVDISSGNVLRYNASDDKLDTFSVPPGNQPVSLAIPVNGSSDELVVTRGLEILVFDVTTGNVTRQLGQVDQDKPGNRFNDGKADPRGRLWAGTMGPEEPGVGVLPKQGTLYLRDNNSTLQAMVSEIDVSNGLAWSKDGRTMFYIDTGTGRVDAFDFDLDTGNISNRRPAYDFVANNISGSPDSMTIDTNNTLWIACWSGWQYVTSVAWGGADLTDLYVTSSRRDLSVEENQQQPLAGTVFKVSGLGAQGFPAVDVSLDP
ncbi:hypothetical protein B566_EDAN004524 [Ephemera danica]|nr:hypothetical protein B566_EDAN004524 [Ephemera danica]